ncbi:hypothetical protein ANCCAN_07837 [Ancylostoma caninum]|uniref:Uncharacterized protein n=1 Tax=Ancylostoma caninum TaxID=29170 RepID=A0A368GRE0_ANCCA|nr:hypothetical protein ANCCAN_07837 [Ancylostoma caninum]
MRAEVHRLPTTKETEEETDRKKQPPSIPASSIPATAGASTNANGNGNTFAVEGIHSTFQPWPSIDEVRARKEQLLKKTPLPFYKTHVHNSGVSSQQSQPGPSTKLPGTVQRTAIPPHRKYEPEASPVVSSTDDERRSASPSRRFRISVSPSRRIETDTVSTGKARRFTIKQESAAPSMTSVRRVTPPQEDRLNTGRAPCVQFGEDDSPRVLEG